MKKDRKLFLGSIVGKLAILMGGAIAATSGNASAFVPVAPLPEANTLSSPSAAAQKTLAPKLILKQQS